MGRAPILAHCAMDLEFNSHTQCVFDDDIKQLIRALAGCMQIFARLFSGISSEWKASFPFKAGMHPFWLSQPSLDGFSSVLLVLAYKIKWPILKWTERRKHWKILQNLHKTHILACNCFLEMSFNKQERTSKSYLSCICLTKSLPVMFMFLCQQRVGWFLQKKTTFFTFASFGATYLQDKGVKKIAGKLVRDMLQQDACQISSWSGNHRLGLASLKEISLHWIWSLEKAASFAGSKNHPLEGHQTGTLWLHVTLIVYGICKFCLFACLRKL